MRWGDTHFVDPQFRWFIGVDVVDGGGEPDHDAIHQCHDNMMAWVFQKFLCVGFVNGVVEYIVRGVHQKGEIGTR